MTYRYLFAGGPWHGQVREIHDPHHWRVPVDGASLTMPGDIVIYSRELIRLGDGVFPVMVKDGATDRLALDAVREALVTALNVTRFDPYGIPTDEVTE